MKFRKKPVVVEATQWFKDGDHPAVIRKTDHAWQRVLVRRYCAAAGEWAGSVLGNPTGMPAVTPVAVLFARADSIYKTLPGCDVYDMERDARTYDGPHPVVAHPPCRAWGRLRHMANPRADERNLARLAVSLVREFGGVLEHPATSTLWPSQGLPEPGQRDGHGGWTLPITQHAWGHRAEKATRLYIVGCDPAKIPAMPLVLGDASHVITSSTHRQKRSHPNFRPEVTRAEREHTPPQLAEWLVELARRCAVERQAP